MDLWGRKDSNLQINYFTYNLRWNCESWLSFRKKGEYSSVLPICILPQLLHYFKEWIINCILIIPYFIQFKKFNSKKNWKIFTEGLEPSMPIRRRCCRPMCIPFHEVDLSVTIEYWVERGTRTLKCFHLRGFADRFLTIRTSQHIF